MLAAACTITIGVKLEELIIRSIDNKAYELEIPEQLKNVGLTLIFHPWKLHLAPSYPFPGQPFLLSRYYRNYL